MRLGFVLLAALLGSTVTRTAHADSLPDDSWATPVVRVTLLDNWHDQTRPKSMLLGASDGKTHHDSADSKDRDPGALVTQALERVWSEVRAYRRPGGAEVIVRGKF